MGHLEKTHLQDRIYTWNDTDFTIHTRLDRWYIPKNVRAVATIRVCAYSDHSAAEIEIHPEVTEKKGKVSWKMNTKLLEDTAFQWDVVAFHKFFQGKKMDYPTIREWWDTAKTHYKEIAITHSV